MLLITIVGPWCVNLMYAPDWVRSAARAESVVGKLDVRSRLGSSGTRAARAESVVCKLDVRSDWVR